MAKKAILDVLESTIGKYVHNLDAQSLNVGVWSGKIQLHNLELNCEAVNAKLAQNAHLAPNLALPFRVIGGRFEKFQVEVPWAKLTSKPVVLSAKGLTVLLEPFDHLAPSLSAKAVLTNAVVKRTTTNKKTKLSRRAQAMLDANDTRLQYNAVRRLADTDDDDTNALSSQESSSNSNTKTTVTDTFLHRLIRRIIENLQLQIEGVNIELKGYNGSKIGLILQNLSLVSTDEQGNPAFVARSTKTGPSTSAATTPEFLHKALTIAGFGLYCDDHQHHQHQQSHSYVLSPLSFRATLRQSDAMQCIDFPKYLVSSNLSHCSILMTKRQLELLSQIGHVLRSTKGQRPLFPEYRPDTPISTASAKLWWHYAVKSVLRITKHRSCWVDFLEAFRKRKIYIPLYKRHVYKATCSWLNKPLTVDEMKTLGHIENDSSVSVEGIMAWRNMADSQVELEGKKRATLAAANQVNNSNNNKSSSNRRLSLMGSLFGSSKGENNNNNKSNNNSSGAFVTVDSNQLGLFVDTDDEEPPFTLTTEEMKELETINLEQSSDRMVSADSKLCDLKFGLLSFKVDLILPDSQPLVSLTMGAVSSSFAANADGSFAFDFSLSSLQIDDKITIKSIFPSVVRTMSIPLIPHQSASTTTTTISSSCLHTTTRQAFQIMLDRTRNGDSHLIVRGAAIELVVSPIFIVGISKFCKISPTAGSNISKSLATRSLDSSLMLPFTNPYLQESVSGNIDLFFDSNEGRSHHYDSQPLSQSTASIVDNNASNAAKEAAFARMSDNLSKALAGAWSGKKKAQRKWTVDLEIHAPILVVPENCTDPQATVLVLDFGRLALKSKKIPSKKVASWFKSNTTTATTTAQTCDGGDVLENVESWRIETSNLTFLVGTACDNDWGPTSSSNNRKPEKSRSESIIEPFSMIFNVGIETSDLPVPRTCIDGVLPALKVVIYLAHFRKVLDVVSAWSLVLRELKADNENSFATTLSIVDDGLPIIDDEEYDSSVLPPKKKKMVSTAEELSAGLCASEKKVMSRSSSDFGVNSVHRDAFEHLHMSIALRRLSAKVVTGNFQGSEGVEAHLVSVVLTTSKSTDGSSLSRICMGWFWILDRLPTSFPRVQRLIAHSSLPVSKNLFSFNDKYDIMEELDLQGVFMDGYEGSSELADIIIIISPISLQNYGSVSQEAGSDISLDAKFSSLFINWNPYAIKALLLTKQYMFESALSSIRHNPEILNLPLSSLHISEETTGMPSHRRSTTTPGDPIAPPTLRLDARMDKLVISFNSAKDDLQLYILTMSGAKIEVLASDNGESLTAFLEVGDFRMETPPMGKTLRQYRTLMGLAPDQSTCLLSVKFFQGPKAVASSGMAGVDSAIHESCAQIFFSPMRFVHIQAQILTLVDYIQEGVFGIFPTTAASAAAAALEMTQAFNGEKLFHIHATSFEFLVPHAAYIQDYFAFHAVKLHVKYRALANFGGGEANIDLSEMSVACNRGISMLKDPVKISIHAWIAPNHAPTEDDRTIKVNMELTSACLYLTQKHFEQILYMLSRNIQEDDFFLRDPQAIGSWHVEKKKKVNNKGSNTMASGNAVDSSTLTHAGVQVLIIKKRILLTIKVQVLALVLCRGSAEEPFMEIAGMQSDINVALLPDQSKLQLGMTLHNLNVEDRRAETKHRYYRKLFTHIKISECTKDVFTLQYCKDEVNGTTNIDIRVGNPQLVVLPDCISEALEFMKTPDIVNMEIVRSVYQRKDLGAQSTVAIAIHDSNEEIEATVEKKPIDPKTMRTNISVKTSTCRIVMVNTESTESSMVSCQLGSMETIVVQGKVDVKGSSLKVLLSGIVLSNETTVNGESLEIYTAQSKNIDCPVQIMEPAGFSISIAKIFSPERGTEDLVIKAAALSSLDVSCSMQNAVLLQDIVNSIKESIALAEKMQARRMHSDKVGDRDPKPLTDTEYDRIENLAFALEHNDQNQSRCQPLKESFGSYGDAGRSSESLSEFTGGQEECQPDRVLSKYYRVHVTVPDVVVTFINDFQGLDAPLFKVRARNMIGNGQSEMLSRTEVNSGINAVDSSELNSMKFRVRLNSAVVADYFDPSSNSWEKLLLKPWESTITLQRGDTHRFKRAVKRMATDVDIESQTCLVSFSEQFLVSIGTALRMWSSEDFIRRMNGICIDDTIVSAIHTARVDSTSISVSVPSPYCIDNQTGLPVYYIVQPNLGSSHDTRQKCETGTVQYFRFQYPRGDGLGGKRLYGQEGSDFKGIELYVGEQLLWFPHVDKEINNPRRAHTFSGGLIIFVDVIKGGKAIVIRLRSRVHLYNNTSLEIAWAVQNKEGILDIGVCPGCCSDRSQRSVISTIHPDADQKMPSLGVPVKLLRNFVASASPAHADAGLTLLISPFQSKRNNDSCTAPSAVASFYGGSAADRWGAIALPPPYALVHMAAGEDPVSTMDIICAPVNVDESKNRDQNIMIVQVCVKISLVDEVHPYVEIFVRPRVLLENRLPIKIMVRTPAAFTLSASNALGEHDSKNPREIEQQRITAHILKPNDAIEVYTQDSSLPISVRCDDAPVAGTETGWSEEWMHVPLGRSRLGSPLRCLFPFKRGKGGIEFFVCEEEDVVNFRPLSVQSSCAAGSRSKLEAPNGPSLQHDKESADKIRTVVFSVANYAVDHTGQLLFESDRRDKGGRSGFCPWSAFSCPRLHRRITLLPNSDENLRMVKLSMEESEGFKRSIPFCVDDISICEGGIQCNAIYWENNKPSGFFAYRRLSVCNQWEVHVVPEFVLFNGGKHNIAVQKINAFHVTISPGKMSHFHGAQLEGLIVVVQIPEICGETKGIQVDSLGTRIRVVRSSENGRPIGSLAVQTVVGAQDSRLVIKIGEVRFGGLRNIEVDKSGAAIFAKDFLRFRIRWSLLEVTLHDTNAAALDRNATRRSTCAGRKDGDKKVVDAVRSNQEREVKQEKSVPKYQPVAQVKFFLVTVDFQRIFKDPDGNDPASIGKDDERSQFSIIVHQTVVYDRTSDKDVVVFESASNASFFDLCLRFKGSLNADLIKVDLLSLNLAHSNGKSESIMISTSEGFVWRLLDVASRIIVAISELAGVNLNLNDIERLAAKSEPDRPSSNAESDNDAMYTPPQSDKLFDVKTAIVSPVKLLISFKRQPQKSRYQLIRDIKFARMVNYFINKLNFTVENAELTFSGYKTTNVKGPPSRLLDEFRTVYVSRLQYQLITLMTSVSIREWKTLTARTEGGDEYVEGDALRMTGHIIGRSAGYMFKKVGEGIGDSLSAVTGSLGENVEKSANMIGLGVVGGAVNSAIVGLGDGVSSTVKGVGSGASKVVKGAGKGVGQIAGGVEGGVTLFAKGIKKGIYHGDGDAVMSGLSDGAASMIAGVGQGLETAFVGATGGVMNVGQGIFNGIGSVGMGFGNALLGVKPSRKKTSSTKESKKDNPTREIRRR